MHHHLHPPKAVLFDWDNTLANTWPIIIEALTRTFIAMDMEPWSAADIHAGRENIHHSLRDSFPKIFGERWQQARDEYYKHFLATHLEVIEPLPGVPQVLDYLKERNIYTTIVSNKTGQYLREEVAHLGWQGYFAKVVGATDAAKDKPYAEPVLMALAGSGFAPGADVWLVGDSMTDVEAALNAGVRPVAYGTLHVPSATEQDNRLVAPVLRVADHQALFDLLRSLE